MRPVLLALLATLLANAPAQGPRLLDRIEAPMLYVSLEADPKAGAATGPVQRLLADPAFDALFGPSAPSGAPSPEASADAASRSLALVRGVLARSSGDLELALTGVLPAAGQPLLVLRARLQADEVERLRGLLEGPQLAAPARLLGGRQTYTLRSSDGAAAADGPGKRVELALVGSDLLVGNDSTALEELLAPPPAVTSAVPAKRVLSADPRFTSLRKQLEVPPGSLLVYGDWQRLGQRLQTSSDGLPSFLLEWSGLGSARSVMATLAGADAAFTGTMLLDFDVAAAPAGRRAPPRPMPPDGRPFPGRDGPDFGGPRRPEGPFGIDGWFAAAQAVPARTLLPELPGSGLGGLVVSVDLAEIASRSRRGASMLHLVQDSLRELGLDFERNVVARLGTRGAIQLLFRRGEGQAATEVVSVYALRAKSRKAAADLFEDLRRATEQRGTGRLAPNRDRRGPEVLELQRPRDASPACVAVFEDFVLLAFDVQTVLDVHEEYRRSAKARSKRDAAVTTAVAAIGGENVVGLFDLDLQPLFERIAASLGPRGAAVDLSRIPQRHIGYLDLQERDGGIVLRVRVLSSR